MDGKAQWLVACPFCGGTADYDIQKTGPSRFDGHGLEGYGQCECGATSAEVVDGAGDIGTIKYLIVGSWNHRPEEDRLREIIGELVGELENVQYQTHGCLDEAECLGCGAGQCGRRGHRKGCAIDAVIARARRELNTDSEGG